MLMKTFYQFLLEAPTPPPAPAGNTTPSPSGPATPPPGSPPAGGPASLGGPSLGSPLGGGMGGPPLGGGSPSLGGGLDMGMQPQQNQSSSVSVQKSKPINVWQALEKLVKNKNGQNQSKMIN